MAEVIQSATNTDCRLADWQVNELNIVMKLNALTDFLSLN